MMSSRRARKLVALTVMVVAGLASLATTPAGRNLEGTLELSVPTSGANQVVARRVDVEITRGSGPIDRAVLQAGPGYDEYGNESPVMSISIVPDDPAEPVRSVTGLMFESLERANQDLQPFCAEGCRRSYTIIMRISPRSTDDALVSLYAYATSPANGTADKRPKATVTLSDEQPLNAVIGLSSTVRTTLYSDLFTNGSWHGALNVPAGAIGVGRAFGSMAVTGWATVDGDKAGGDIWVIVNGVGARGTTVAPGAREIRFEREWLSACSHGQDCAVPIDVELRWNPGDFFGMDFLLIGGNVEISLTLEARLEYIGEDAVPAGATLELSPR